MTASKIHYEIADRRRATANGGIGAIHRLVRKLELDPSIDRHHRLQPAGRGNGPGTLGTAAYR